MPASKQPVQSKNCVHCKKEFFSNNKKRIFCHNRCSSSLYKKKNPEKHRKLASDRWRRLTSDQKKHRAMLTKYGITIDQYKEMCFKQAGKCAICKQTAKLHIDHDHSTGQVRGLLCNGCNRGLGFFSENKVAINEAALYLTKWSKQC